MSPWRSCCFTNVSGGQPACSPLPSGCHLPPSPPSASPDSGLPSFLGASPGPPLWGEAGPLGWPWSRLLPAPPRPRELAQPAGGRRDLCAQARIPRRRINISRDRGLTRAKGARSSWAGLQELAREPHFTDGGTEAQTGERRGQGPRGSGRAGATCRGSWLLEVVTLPSSQHLHPKRPPRGGRGAQRAGGAGSAPHPGPGLLTTDGLAVFQAFLRTEFSEENLEFWLACEDFKKVKSQSKMAAKAKKIFAEYIAIQACKEVRPQAPQPTPVASQWPRGAQEGERKDRSPLVTNQKGRCRALCARRLLSPLCVNSFI